MLPGREVVLRVLAVITARGGSKGLPRKNVREVGGKPLIAWTIEAALGAGEALHRTVVSTDDEEIAAVCAQWGGDAPFRRPAALAGDQAGTVPTLQHAVRWVEADEGAPVDWVLTLQPTSPLRTADDIVAAVALAADRSCDSVIAVTPVHDSHPMVLREVREGRLHPHAGHSLEGVRRQDCEPPVFRNNGALYLTRREVLMDQGRIHGQVALAHVMPEERSVDVDTELDLLLADAVLRRGAAA